MESGSGSECPDAGSFEKERFWCIDMLLSLLKKVAGKETGLVILAEKSCEQVDVFFMLEKYWGAWFSFALLIVF